MKRFLGIRMQRKASGRKSSTRFTWTGLSETGFRVSERRDHVDATPPREG
jgi:hypothetical protein